MTKIERIKAALKGQEVDSVPMSFWRHFLQQERDPALLADALLAFQREYEWDFMKVNPRASYHVEGWGNRYRYGDDPNVSPVRVSHVVHSRSDWSRIDVLDIWATEPLKQQLVLLELVKEGLQDENLYFLQTVFSPLSIALRLAGHSKERLVEAMESEATELQAALEAITETFVRYARASIDAGAAGIFFAVTGLASGDVMTQEQYERFGVPYDLRVLKAVKGRPGFNMLHLCGANVFFDRLVRYPVDAVSWDVFQPGNPGLQEGREKSGKMVVGGVDHTDTMAQGTPEEVAGQVDRAIAETRGRGCVIAPGCTFPTSTKRELLVAALAARDRHGG